MHLRNGWVVSSSSSMTKIQYWTKQKCCHKPAVLKERKIREVFNKVQKRTKADDLPADRAMKRFFLNFCYFGLFKGSLSPARTRPLFGSPARSVALFAIASKGALTCLLRDSCLYCYFSKAICLSVCLWGLSECSQSHRHNDWPTIVCHSIH